MHFSERVLLTLLSSSKKKKKMHFIIKRFSFWMVYVFIFLLLLFYKVHSFIQFSHCVFVTYKHFYYISWYYIILLYTPQSRFTQVVYFVFCTRYMINLYKFVYKYRSQRVKKNVYYVYEGINIYFCTIIVHCALLLIGSYNCWPCS